MPAFAAQTTAATTMDQATAVAKKYVPSDSVLMKTEDDGDRYEIKYYSASYHERYEIDVSKATGKMLSFNSDADNDDGAISVTITEAAAKKVVTDEIPNPSYISAYVKWDDGLAEYRVSFTTAALYGEYEIHPQSGRVLKRDITMAQPGTTASQNAAATAASAYITPEKATSLALAQVNGKVTDLDFDYKYGRAVYKVEVFQDYKEYDFVFDAVSGALISAVSENDPNFTSHYVVPPTTGTQGNAAASSQAPATGTQGSTAASQAPATGDIGMERARQLAQSKAPAGSVLVKIEMDYEHGRLVYEGKLQNGFWEYEFEIDGATGNFLKWESDYDD